MINPTTTKRTLLVAACLLFIPAMPAQIAPAKLPPAKAGDPYSYAIRVAGGLAPFHFVMTDGSLPEGLSLDDATGKISGTPTAAKKDPFEFVISVRDDAEQKFDQPFTLTVAAAPLRIVTAPEPVRIVTEEETPDPTAAPVVAAPEAPVQRGNGNRRGALTPQAAPDAARPATDQYTIAVSDGDDQTGPINKELPKPITVKVIDGDKKPLKGVVISFSTETGATLASSSVTTGDDGLAATKVTLGGTIAKVTIKATAPGVEPIYFWAIATQPTSNDLPSGDLTRIVLGVEQVGASSAPSVRKFFFDFYNDRPVGRGSGIFGSSFRWWGNVRIGSVPVQTTAALSALAKGGLVADFRGMTLNELAQAGEFQTGFAWNMPHTSVGPIIPINHGTQYSTLSLFAGVGATLPFDPKSNVSVFDLPALKDASGNLNQGRQRFNDAYSGFATNAATQVAFTTPDRNQFFRQYFGGIRLNTLYVEKDSSNNVSQSLGTVSFSIGQNEAVTGGKLRGLVAQAEGFFPLPGSLGVKGLSAFYLFGRASFQLTSSVQTAPLLLNPSATQPADFGSVLVIASPSRRDLYSIGIGIDGLKLAKGLLSAAGGK